MRVIVASDIFGRTAALESLCARIAADYENVVLHKTGYPHGFMNRLSRNFSQEGFSLYIDGLRSWGSKTGASGDVDSARGARHDADAPLGPQRQHTNAQGNCGPRFISM